MLKRKLKFIAAVIGMVGIFAIPTSLSLISCSKNSTESSTQSFDVVLNQSSVSTKSNSFATITNTNTNVDNTITPNRPSVLPFWPSNGNSENEIDPNFNQNAIMEFLLLIKATIDKITETTKKIIESDLNDVVLDFLSTIENENHNTEISLCERTDINDNVIKVNNISFDKDFFNTKKININLTVNYNIERDTKHKDNKTNSTTTFDFPFYIEFVGMNELIPLVQKIQKHDANISGTNNEVDFKDIKEIFLGEHYKNDKNGWKDAFKHSNSYEYDYDKSSLQDIGLINYVSSFNSNVSSNAKMLGYTFNISDFWVALEASISGVATQKDNVVNSQDLTFWAPSTYLNKMFVPNFGNVNNEYNLKIDIDNLKSSSGHETFESSYSTFKNLLTTNVDNPISVYNELNKICKISLPESTIQNLASAKISPSNNLNADDDDFEIKLKDKFGNKFEFEFYKSWWF